MDLKQVKEAEDTLVLLVRTFRAAEGLLATLETVKEGVKFVSTLEAKKGIAQAELDKTLHNLAVARGELEKAEADKARADKAAAAIKAQLKGLGL